jgi:hypothetical protein
MRWAVDQQDAIPSAILGDRYYVFADEFGSYSLPHALYIRLGEFRRIHNTRGLTTQELISAILDYTYDVSKVE